jgi:hypothetical protein
MRLIDADALIEKAYWHGEHPDVENLYAEGVEAADVSDIDDAPTIEAEPVRHGRWEKADNLKPKCSVCGEFHLYSWPDHKKCNYCPNCGAKMDGDDHAV